MTSSVLFKKGVHETGRPFAVIDGIEYTVPNHLIKDLNEINVSDTVIYNETNNILTRIKKTSPQKHTPIINGNGKNERMMTAGMLMKCYTELWINIETPGSVSFDTARQQILKAVEEDVDEVLRIGGA